MVAGNASALAQDSLRAKSLDSQTRSQFGSRRGNVSQRGGGASRYREPARDQVLSRNFQPRARIAPPHTDIPGRGARSLPEGSRRAPRERERARDQALGRAPLGEPSAGAPKGQIPNERERRLRLVRTPVVLQEVRLSGEGGDPRCRSGVIRVFRNVFREASAVAFELLAVPVEDHRK